MSFLPKQQMSEKLKKIISTWCSPTTLVDVRLILKKEEIQPLCLNTKSEQGLAQNAFLMTQNREANLETCYALFGELQ